MFCKKCFSTGEPYSESWQGEWRYLYSLTKDHPNSGSFKFLPKIAEGDFSRWELGALRVSSSNYLDGMWYVHDHQRSSSKTFSVKAVLPVCFIQERPSCME